MLLLAPLGGAAMPPTGPRRVEFERKVSSLMWV